MQPTVLIDSAHVEGSQFSLLRRGEEWLVRVGSNLLMSSRVHASEEALASLSLDRVRKPKRVLVGGLGLGFTLRAVLDKIGPDAEVIVAEIVPALVRWNRQYVGHLANHPLADSRVTVWEENVLEGIVRSSSDFDLILLDGDNGPTALSTEKNGRLYEHAGARACFRALRAGGALSVWSAGPCSRYEKLLRQVGFVVTAETVPASTRGRSRHVLFVATAATPGSARSR
jgi:spermidine synthase